MYSFASCLAHHVFLQSGLADVSYPTFEKHVFQIPAVYAWTGCKKGCQIVPAHDLTSFFLFHHLLVFQYLRKFPIDRKSGYGTHSHNDDI